MIRFIPLFKKISPEEPFKSALITYGAYAWFVKEKKINQYKTVTKIIRKRAHLYINLWFVELTFHWVFDL